MENMLKINKRIDEIIDLIQESCNYRQYLELKKQMLDNDNINNIINEIKDLQKKIVKEEYNGNDISYLEDDINKKLSILNDIPLYVEFTKYQGLFNEELVILKEKINNYIENL